MRSRQLAGEFSFFNEFRLIGPPFCALQIHGVARHRIEETGTPAGFDSERHSTHKNIIIEFGANNPPSFVGAPDLAVAKIR
jgi:hypothetical protein